jgi:hypothetical protein
LRESPERDFAVPSGILRENSAFPLITELSCLFSQEDILKKARGIRRTHKILINAFIISV